MANPDISIVLPCLNEEGNVTNVLDHIVDCLSSSSFSYEIIVVDDVSTDKTLQEAKIWAKKNPGISIQVEQQELERRGYGAVLRRGVSLSRGELITFVSADMVDPIEQLPIMIRRVREGADLCQCNRHEGQRQKELPRKYIFFQFWFRLLLWIALGKKMSDSTYSFKVFKKQNYIALGIHMNGFAVSPEIFLKHVLAKKNVSYVSAKQGKRIRGTSKFNFKREGWGYFYCLIRTFLHRTRISFWF